MLRRVEMKAQRHYFHINGDLAYRLELDADGQPTPDRRLAQLEVFLTLSIACCVICSTAAMRVGGLTSC